MHLDQLIVYPLKSAMGLPQMHAKASAIGLDGDRCWMVARPDGQFLTGRQHPVLTQLKVLPAAKGVILAAEGRAELYVECAALTVPIATTVWKQQFEARTGHTQADAWLSELLGGECRLLYLGEHTGRQHAILPDQPLSFADGYPYLLIGQASLADLNFRLAKQGLAQVSMRQFRPNLVVAGAEAYAEDQWRKIRIGEVIFESVKPCTRCVFTTVDPDSGLLASNQQPLRTLADYRRFEIGVCFGHNLIARNTGRLHIGDDVEILA